jgi:hypothetical protein
MVRINRLLEAMRAQSQPEGMRLAGLVDDGHDCTRPDTVTDEAHQPVTGAEQNELMGAYCWIAVAGDDYPQRATAIAHGLAARWDRQ